MLPKLESKRLIFKPFEMIHAESLFEMDKNPNVHKYLWQEPVQNIEEVKDVIKKLLEQYKRNKIGRYSTILKETEEFIGWTGIKFVDDHTENGNTNFYDYGYRLDERFWGKGYATEATEFWLEYGFNQIKLKDLHAYTHFENIASNDILKKCGFKFIETYIAKNNVAWNWWKIIK
ncbi:GNAT family N-acetyltransferase [Flavobacterium oreochromis]|uniref:GNAT family N-acetyltransferase n=1 Tax=Flavobacterium oreochromis TaxID=2906078 RepID=UPI00385C768F